MLSLIYRSGREAVEVERKEVRRMTNEQLAAFIKQGGNEELIPILWERIRKLMYMKSDRVYSALQSRFNQCGYDVWDLKQSCYTAFLKAIEGYKPESGNKFTAYLSYPFRTAVQELTGMRTQKQKQEPLNSCASLDMPLNKDEPEKLTLADTIADDNAVNAPERVELEDDYRVLHEAVDRLKEPQNRVINAYYFENKSLKDIGAEMRISPERVRQYKAKGLRCLRCSPLLKQLYRENLRHKQLRRLQWCQTRPDKHLYIAELEERYAKVLQFTT